MPLLNHISTELAWLHHTKDSLKKDSFDLHCHNYYELFYFIEGDAGYRVEGTLYQPKPHSLLLIPPRAFHGIQIQAKQSYERYALHFLPGLLQSDQHEHLLRAFELPLPYFEACQQYGLEEHLQSILETGLFQPTMQQEVLSCRIQALLLQIYQMAFLEKHPTSQTVEQNEFTKNLIAFINKHLTEPLTLDHLASYFFISKNQLNRRFHEATGTTIGQYIQHKRAALAQNLMISGLPATTACLEAGFRDYSNFFRTYKQVFGHSPAQISQQRQF